MLQKMEKQQLSTRVAEQLCALITAGTYGVGDRLPSEPQLSEELGVGRSTVREAVQGLAHAGILESRHGKGVFVISLPSDTEPLSRQLGRAKIADVHEARRAIEVEIAALAAQRRTADDLADMQQALDLRETIRLAGVDIPAFVDADLVFHNAIARACGNDVLVGLYKSFSEVIRSSLIGLVDLQGMDDTQVSMHDQLFNAIKAGDPEEARKSVESLLRDIVERF